MRTWPHEQLLSRPQTEDSFGRRRRVVQGSGSPNLLREPLLGQTLRQQGTAGRTSRAPKKRPGSAPKLDEKANKLLEDDLQERPYLTLQDRCDYLEAITGLSVSRSTMCRAIARIGSTRKKGANCHRTRRRVREGNLVAGDGGRGGGVGCDLAVADLN
jgi:hypothetical protein